MQFTTADLRPDEQFEGWSEVVPAVFAPVTLSRPDVDEQPSAFAAACQARRIGDLTLAWLAASPHAVARSANHVRRLPGGVYFLSLTMRGTASSPRGRGLPAPIPPGELVLVDSDRPFDLVFVEEVEQLCLTIPKAMVDSRLASSQLPGVIPLCRESASASVVAAALHALAGQRAELTPREAVGVAESVAHLVALAVSEATLVSGGSPKEALVQRILDEVERGFPDPGLSPALVARRVSISVSYLTKLLHCRGTTFGHLLLERRLDHAWSLLDPALANEDRTVTAIAVSCGFRDSAHFARTFRGRFGITPSQRRAGGRSDLVPLGARPTVPS